MVGCNGLDVINGRKNNKSVKGMRRVGERRNDGLWKIRKEE